MTIEELKKRIEYIEKFLFGRIDPENNRPIKKIIKKIKG